MSIFKQNSAGFRQSIERMGYPRSTVEAVWPEWWSAEAEHSKTAQTELRLTVARRLGLRPTTLFETDVPEFVWQHEAKFKGLAAFDDRERGALTSFGQAFAQSLLPFVEPFSRAASIAALTAAGLRTRLLANDRPFVDIVDLCALCWGLGIPIVHLRVFPLPAKRMAAMAVRVGERYAILIGRDASFPAPIAFHIAHELGHIVLGHLEDATAIVDAKILERDETDEEEIAADAFALSLLTGSERPTFTMDADAASGIQLARAAFEGLQAGRHQIEPGVLCLCYGFQTGDWKVANAALHSVYTQRGEVWKMLNKTATREINWEAISPGGQAYIRAVLGAADLA